MTLFNAFDPIKSSDGLCEGMANVYGYGKVDKGSQHKDARNITQKGMDIIQGFLWFRSRTTGDYQYVPTFLYMVILCSCLFFSAGKTLADASRFQYAQATRARFYTSNRLRTDILQISRLRNGGSRRTLTVSCLCTEKSTDCRRRMYSSVSVFTGRSLPSNLNLFICCSRWYPRRTRLRALREPQQPRRTSPLQRVRFPAVGSEMGCFHSRYEHSSGEHGNRACLARRGTREACVGEQSL